MTFKESLLSLTLKQLFYIAMILVVSIMMQCHYMSAAQYKYTFVFLLRDITLLAFSSLFFIYAGRYGGYQGISLVWRIYIYICSLMGIILGLKMNTALSKHYSYFPKFNIDITTVSFYAICILLVFIFNECYLRERFKQANS